MYLKLSLFTLLLLSGFLIVGGQAWGLEALKEGLFEAGKTADFITGGALIGSTENPTRIGGEAVTLEQTAATLIRAVLGLTGIIALIIIIYAGFLYLTASGKPEQIKKAQGMLVYAAIGLVLIFGAYTLASYVTRQLEQTTIAEGK